MIQEVDINEIKEIYDPDGLFYLCCEVPQSFVYFDNYSRCPAFYAPMSRERKAGLISQDEFERKYKIQMNSPICIDLVGYMRNLNNNVYLVTNVETGTLMSIINSI
jgi:hypothetical protein